MPTGLPSIVPRTGFNEDAGFFDGGMWGEEVGGGGEEFVGEGVDCGAERGGDEIDGVRMEGGIYEIGGNGVRGWGGGVLDRFGGEGLNFHDVFGE